MSKLKELERKVDLLIKFVVCLDSEHKDSLMKDLEDLKAEVAENRKPLSHTVEDFLTDFGIPSNIQGYWYLVTAVSKVVENPDLISSICKELYPDVAKEHHTTPSRAERAIRHAIESTVYRADVEMVRRVFGNTLAKGDRPTNSEFISRVAQIIRHEMEERDL